MFFVLAQVLSSLPLRRPSSQVITFSIRSVQICSSVHSAHLSLVPSILRRPVFSVSCFFLSFAISFVLLSFSPFFHLSIPHFFSFSSHFPDRIPWCFSLVLSFSYLTFSLPFPSPPIFSFIDDFIPLFLFSFLCTLNKPRHLTLSKPCHFTLSKPCHFTLLLSRWAGQGVAVCSVCYATVDFKVPGGGALAAG